MRWKIWILPFGVFAGLCLLGEAAITCVLIPRTQFSDSARLKRLFLDHSDVIPIFGTSRAHSNISPAYLGLNAFNYGMDGISFEVSDALLQIELAKPRTTPIIVELQQWDTGSIGYEGKFIPFFSDPRIHQLLTNYHAMEWRYYLPGIRYFGYYEVYLQDYLNERLNVVKGTNGFIEVTHPPPFDRAQFDGFVQDRLQHLIGYVFDEDQNRRLIAHITGHPQRLFILTFSPYHSSYYTHVKNQDKLAAFEKQLNALPNVILIDCHRMEYPDEMFLDTIHMRPEGAADFSRKLGAKIRQAMQERNERFSTGKTGAKQPQ